MPKHRNPQIEPQEANASGHDEVLTAIGGLRGELMATLTTTAKVHTDKLQELQCALGKIESKIDDTMGRVAELETATATHSDSIHAMEVDISAMKQELATLKIRCEDLEARSRRCNLRIVGVKEGREEGKLMSGFVAELLKETLQLASTPLLDRAHRTLRGKPVSGDAPPRAIVIKCHYFNEREAILRKATGSKQLTTKDGDKILVLPDYTMAVSKQRAAFNEVRSLLRGLERVRYGLLFPATLRITTPEGEEHRFKDPLKAKEFISTKLSSGK